MKYDYDVIILGSGPAGFSCAMQSSKFGKKALVIEANEKYLGGAWINTGTVPSKALRETARIIQRYHNQFPDEENIKPYAKYEMAELLSYKEKTLKSKNKKVAKDLKKNEVDIYRGFGVLIDPNTVEVKNGDGETKKFTAEYILVATGSKPIQPKNFKLDHNKILDYASILTLTHIPRRLVVIGIGVNAIEYATTFSKLGTRVTILNENDTFLRWLDHEIAEQVHEILADNKIEIVMPTKNIRIKDNDIRNVTEVSYQIKDDKEPGRKYVIETEHVLYLGGKTPNTKNIGLDKVGIKLDKEGFVKVDKDMRSSVESIYAAGDVVGFPRLASASFTQGRIASCKMFDIARLEVEAEIPYGIYSIPEMSNIGLTENEAREKGLDITVGRAYYKNITQGDVSNQQTGLLKLVFDTKTLKLLGIHIIGERASDLIHLGQAVMSLGGDIRYFINHVLNYPTYSELYRVAAFNGINRVYKAGVKYKKLLK